MKGKEKSPPVGRKGEELMPRAFLQKREAGGEGNQEARP